ncbi:hypothetical protein CSC79_11435 [Pseudoalteromonas sp. 3D05]|nr:hypothetical protein CSC79_11435 [Pseudoalteromonas sp. 3D05]
MWPSSRRLCAHSFSRYLQAFFYRKRHILPLGGEEFLCVLPQTKADDAIVLAKQIQQDLLRHPVHINEQSFTLFVSVGVSEISHSDSIDSAIKQADENLYLAKTSGKNKVCGV